MVLLSNFLRKTRLFVHSSTGLKKAPIKRIFIVYNFKQLLLLLLLSI